MQVQPATTTVKTTLALMATTTTMMTTATTATDHLVSFYAATCGQNGPGLGADEKDIILLVYVVIETLTAKVVGRKEILVRPSGYVNKDRTLSASSSSDALALPALAQQPITTAIAASNNISNSNHNYNNNNSNTNNGTITTNGLINSSSNSGSSNSSGNSNSNNNNANNSTSSNSSLALLPTENSVVAVAAAVSAGVGSNEQMLPITEALVNGKPLKEAIEEFDAYLRSLGLQEADVTLVTDGQAPLRQCLHREACTKDIELPTYYNKFCDLRKEYVSHRSGDLSRALVLAKDFSKVLRAPLLPMPQSIAEMLKELNITCNTNAAPDDVGYFVRESYEMVQIIRTLILSGHKFIANEIINLVLEPGICSANEEIDGLCIVRARGLPWQSSDQDIAKFFRGLNIAKGGVALCLSPMGRRNGEALVRFVSQEHRDMALKRHKHHIGPRYIEVYRANGEDFLSVAGGASNEAQAFLSKGAEVIIRMRGLPYDCNAKQVLDFFTTGENPCNVHEGTDGVLFVKKPDGRATGDAFVLFEKEADVPHALGRHRESIGQRYIELFRSTAAEVQQVLNRSLDPKSFEQNNHAQPPLIAQLPTVQLPLLPQHLITSGTTKNCIRLRGLPYEANVEHILHFLDDFAKHIIYQGVHMVINAQGQPNGEAFIQMDAEDSARLCAQRKHNQFMVFGKKYRYIEVFQCSGDDMNVVLNSGLQSPVSNAHAPTHATHAMAAAGKAPTLLSPGACTPVLGAGYAPFTHFGPPPPPHTHLLATTTRNAHHAATHAHHAATTFYAHPLVYWPYPSPPVSPNGYFTQSAHTPAHVGAANTALYPIDFVSAGTPMSPPTIAIPHTTAGILLSPHKAPPPLTFVQTPKQFTTSPLTPNYHNAAPMRAQSVYYHTAHSTPSPPAAGGGGGGGGGGTVTVVTSTLLPLATATATAAAPATFLINGNNSPELVNESMQQQQHSQQGLLQQVNDAGDYNCDSNTNNNNNTNTNNTNANAKPQVANQTHALSSPNEAHNHCLYIL